MLKLVYALVLGLVGAIVVHIAIVFILPTVAGGRGHAAAVELANAAAGRGLPPAAVAAAGVNGIDPSFRLRICPFDLTNGPFSVQSEPGPTFFSAAILDDRDLLAFSIVDRLAFDRKLDLEILPKSEERRRKLRESAGLITNQTTVPVFVSRTHGYVVVRAFVPDAATAPRVDAFLAAVRCAPVSG